MASSRRASMPLSAVLLGFLLLVPGRLRAEIRFDLDSPPKFAIPNYAPATFATTTADLDGNGLEDIVIHASDRATVLLNIAGGEFERRVFATGTQYNMATAVAAADIDGDAVLDLVLDVRWGTDGIILPGDGLGGFGEPLTFPAPNGNLGLAVGDLDGDGRTDIITESTFLLGHSLLSGDFDGDGARDLLVRFSGGTKILWNNGDGTFDDEHPFHREDPLAVGDIDGDGIDDFFLHHGVEISTGDRGNGVVIPYPDQYASFSFVAAADWNADGLVDVALSGGDVFDLHFLGGTGNGEFVNPSSLAVPPGFTPLTGDFNEDGLPDLIGVTEEGFYFAPNTTGRPEFRRGDIDGDSAVDIGDAVAHLFCLFTGATTCTTCADARDVNDDGRADISDAVGLLDWLFRRGPPPAAPVAACGWDPTGDALNCPESTPACR